MSSTIEITPELMAGFLDEAPEYLDMLDVGLMELESKAGTGVLSLDAPEDQEQMTVMFRAAHSLKGLAAAFGFVKIKELTHRMETLFDQVRMRKRDLSGESFETLFQVFDRLKALVQELSDESARPVQIEDILSALDHLLEETSGANTTNTTDSRSINQAADQQSEVVVEPSTKKAEPAESSPRSSSSADANEPLQAEIPPSPVDLQNELFDDPELAALFVETTVEAIDELNQGLLGLEENPDNPDLMNKVFRCAHNIKGASGAAGLGGMNRLTHEMETVFDLLRSGKLTLSEELMNAIFQTVDRLRLTIENIRLGRMDDIAEHEMCDQFHPWIEQKECSKNSGDSVSATVEEAQTNQPVSHETGKTQHNNKEYESAGTGDDDIVNEQDSDDGDEKPVRITVIFADQFDEACIQAYLIYNKLGELGTVVSANPNLDTVTGDSELKRIEFVIRTEVDPIEIERIVGTYDVERVIVSPGVKSIVTEVDKPSTSSSDDRSNPEEASTTPVSVTEKQPLKKPVFGGVASSAPADHASASKPVSAPVATASSTSSPAGSSRPKASDRPSAPPATSATAATQKKTQTQAKSSTDATGKPGGNLETTGIKTGETLRVDQERLDQLMNLGGELVINRARFVQIHGKFREVFGRKNLGLLVEDMTEHMNLLENNIDSLEVSNNNAREVDELRSHMLHLTQSFNTVRSLVCQVYELRTSMFDFDEALHGLSRVSEGLRKGIMSTRMVSIGPLFSRFRRVVRDISKSSGKKVELVLHGETTELDKRMIDELGDPLTHMVRNSVDHGIEMPDVRQAAGKDPTGHVILEASHRGNSICIEVIDDGAGLNIERIKEKIIERELATPSQVENMTDRDLYQFIFKPGFSTAQVVTDLSGRGMGMDIVVSKIDHLNGTVEVDSTPGQGARITIKLPLTLAILTSMVVRIGKGIYALPLETVAEILTVRRDEIQWIQKRPVIRVRGRVVPVVFFEDIFETDALHLLTRTRNDKDLNLVIVGFEKDKIGLVVDELLGQEDIVIKSIAENYENVRGFAGASIRGDGAVSLILDVSAMMEMAARIGVQEPSPVKVTVSAEG